jgi:hypothetical protein
MGHPSFVVGEDPKENKGLSKEQAKPRWPTNFAGNPGVWGPQGLKANGFEEWVSGLNRLGGNSSLSG